MTDKDLRRYMEIERKCRASNHKVNPEVLTGNEFDWLLLELSRAWAHLTKRDKDCALYFVDIEKLREESASQKLELADRDMELRFCAGFMSCSDQFKSLHPDEVLEWIKIEAKKIRDVDAKWDRTTKEVKE